MPPSLNESLEALQRELREIRRTLQWQTLLLGAIAAAVGGELIPGV